MLGCGAKLKKRTRVTETMESDGKSTGKQKEIRKETERNQNGTSRGAGSDRTMARPRPSPAADAANLGAVLELELLEDEGPVALPVPASGIAAAKVGS
jgi:hypothetical protein